MRLRSPPAAQSRLQRVTGVRSAYLRADAAPTRGYNRGRLAVLKTDVLKPQYMVPTTSSVGQNVRAQMNPRSMISARSVLWPGTGPAVSRPRPEPRVARRHRLLLFRAARAGCRHRHHLPAHARLLRPARHLSLVHGRHAGVYRGDCVPAGRRWVLDTPAVRRVIALRAGAADIPDACVSAVAQSARNRLGLRRRRDRRRAWALLDRPDGGWTDTIRLNNYYTNAIPFGDTALLLDSSPSSRSAGTRRAPLHICAQGARTGGGRLRIVSVRDPRRLARDTRVSVAAGRAVPLARAPQASVADRRRDCGRRRGAGVHGTLRAPHRRRHLRHYRAATRRGPIRRSACACSCGAPRYGCSTSIRCTASAREAGRRTGGTGAARPGEHRRSSTSARIATSSRRSPKWAWSAWRRCCCCTSGCRCTSGANRHSTDPATRTAAWSGLAVSSSTLIFGLTIDVLVPIMVTTLLALLSATFLAMIDARRRELATRPA